MMSKIAGLILKDVKNENETKKASVILRVNSLLISFYFICLAVVFGTAGHTGVALLGIFCCMGHLLPLYLTYMNRTILAVVFAQMLIIGCVVVFVLLFGWQGGFQYFLFVALVLNFTTTYVSVRYKLLHVMVLGIVLLGLYFYVNLVHPDRFLSETVLSLLFVLNMLCLFATMTAALTFFSKDSNEMENKLMKYNEKMHLLASVDPLTGLLNRRGMKEFLAVQEKSYREGNGVNISIAMGDIDFFKKINDTYGHDCGDEILKFLSALFSRFMEGKGKVSRWGGEEYLFVFHGYNGDEAYLFMNELLGKVRKSVVDYEGRKVAVTLTFGLEEMDFRRSVEDSINEADKKLYLGKNEGRNRIVY